jgi:hypothetical protein
MARPKLKNKLAKSYPCATRDCPGEVGEKSITGLCKQCYSSLRYSIKNHNRAQRLERAENLLRYSERLNFLLSESDVKALSQRPRAKYQTLAVLPGNVKAYRKRKKYKVVK